MSPSFVRTALILLAGVLATLAIGLADYVTGPDVLLSLLYLVVIGPVAWWGGRGPAVVVALVASVLWTVAQIATSPADPWVNAWNAMSRAIIFGGAGILVGALREEQERLRLVDREREEFLTLVAHELRQPVAAIDVTATALASSPGLTGPERRVMDGLRSQARRLTGLAEDLLTIGRLEGGIALTPADIDLRDVVEDVIRGSEGRARLVSHRPDEPVTVHGDVFRLRQALDNLVSNALKYSPPDQLVDVSVTSDGGRARVDVRDHGIGLASSEVTKLFRKYGRLETVANTGVQGAGLGLYLVRLIAESHGGRVSAASDGKGRGSTFTLEIPLKRW